MKKQNGITLVALIITIIVMAILVGVVLLTSVMEGGIIDRAEDALVEKERAELEEIIIGSYVYKKSASMNNVLVQLDLEETAKALYSNLEGTEYKLKTSSGTDAQSYEDIFSEGATTITLKVEGKRGTYEGTVEKTGLRDGIKVAGDTGNVVPPADDGNNPPADDEIIPEGGTYTTASGEVYNAGDNFPETVTEGDIYVYGDYKYTYRNCYFDGDLFDKSTYEEDFGTTLEGWSVIVIDNTKTQYGEILSNINGENVTNLVSTFSGCESLETSPVIPDTVVDMFYTFSYCEKLEEAPIIPSGVTNMGGTFSDCVSLVEAPIIPEGVTDMGEIFYGCTLLTNVPNIPSKVVDLGIAFYYCESLTTVPAIPSMVENMEETFKGCKMLEGEIEINANPSETNGCFYGTKKSIILTGTASDETKESLKNTSPGNITWE